MIFSSCILASDHAGFFLREHLARWCCEWELPYQEVGALSEEESFDYPLCIDPIKTALERHDSFMGVLLCGSGIGLCMAANRHPSLRAALCHDVTSAFLARSHNNANVLVLGARLIGTQTALACFDVFLKTPFEGGRHQRRLDLF